MPGAIKDGESSLRIAPVSAREGVPAGVLWLSLSSYPGCDPRLAPVKPWPAPDLRHEGLRQLDEKGSPRSFARGDVRRRAAGERRRRMRCWRRGALQLSRCPAAGLPLPSPSALP